MDVNLDEVVWVEKFRPRKISDCILPERLSTIFKQFLADDEIPNLLLVGGAGLGKTTVARALCEESSVSYMFINGSNERGIDVLRTKISNYASTMGIGGKRKVIIIDECDAMSADLQAGMRAAVEEFSSNCTFVMTCNFPGKLIEAIHSRFATIEFTVKATEKTFLAIAFFKRVKEILDYEKVQYDRDVLSKIVMRYFPDFRRTLGELQKLSKLGAIDIAALNDFDRLKEMEALFSALKEKKFNDMRKWVANNSDVEYSQLYRKLFESLNQFVKQESIPAAILTLAKYQYQAGFVPDQEINTAALMTELMVDCHFI